MEYRLIVTKQEKNPEYTPKYSPYQPEKQEFLVNQTALEVILNEEEFNAVKKAVIGVIK